MRKDRGFTLMELMVVIGIVSLLLSVLLFSMSQSRARARDAERISDMKQIQVALELYYDRNREFPAALTDLMPYIHELPHDPVSGRIDTEDDYQYLTDGTDYGLAIQNDDGTTWCKAISPGAPFFSSYQECPFGNTEE